jgi:lipopolysaccharide/colanic/teichoic acid biosynthesis glycosyltransferase
MVKSECKQSSLPEDGATLSQHSDGAVPRKHSSAALYYPRYVSAWCMSKRKRCFDLVFGVAALILFSPIMLLIACLIKMTSKGPALFRQERVGLHQQPFVIFKFRTMKALCEQADRGLTVTKHGDPRMTKVGALLRRLKLDELPQLVNVVRGEMSFVGPRPKIRQHESLCMLCRPGITGAATIEFSHEEKLLTDVPAEFVEHYVTTVLNPEKCRLDANYIETTRFRTDLKILIDTVFNLGKRPIHAFPAESARFLLARSAVEPAAGFTLNHGEDGVPSTKKVRQSA